MLHKPEIPSLLIANAEAATGKTTVACAIAARLRFDGFRVAVCKPIDTKCVRRREGLVSEDAEFLAACADARHPLDLICPQRFADPQLPPALAAERHQQPIEWETINRSIGLMSRGSDVVILESPCLLTEPVDAKLLMLDAARELGAPVVVVARPSLASLGHTLAAVSLLRSANVRIAGVVVNRYPAENASVNDEANWRAIDRWGKVPVLAIVPDEPIARPLLPPGIMSAIGAVDWPTLIGLPLPGTTFAPRRFR